MKLMSLSSKKEHPDDKVIVNGVDISQYLIDEETDRKDAEEGADEMHEILKMHQHLTNTTLADQSYKNRVIIKTTLFFLYL